MMQSKRICFLAVAALLLAGTGDCLSQLQADSRAMECCASMPCTPEQARDCCKAMALGHPQYFQAAVKASIPQPAQVAAATILEPPSGNIPGTPAHPFDAKEHAPPPELYTLHASLLI